MVNLTLKDLINDKKKFILVCLGLTTSILLVLFGVGMLNGTLNEATNIIENSSADAWITQENRGNALYGSYISGDLCDNVTNSLETDNVYVEKLIYVGGVVDHGNDFTTLQMVGINVSSKLLKPWDVVSGDVTDLNTPFTALIDESFKNSLPGVKIDDEIVINGVNIRVIGFCRNNKFFISSYAWMSLETAQIINNMGNGTSFLLVKYKSGSGYNLNQLKTDLNEIENVDIFSKTQISANTRDYMLYESGAGIGVGIMVVMGLFVSLIIIFLTMYSNVNEKTPEFGTLKAVGASKSFLYKMLMGQVGLLMTLSYIFGTILTYVIGFYISDITTMPIQLNLYLIIVFYCISLLVGIFAILIAIRKVNKIDPIIVFKS